MTGYLVWQETHRRIHYYEESLGGGITLLRAELPCTSRPSRRQRLICRAATLLCHHVVTRFLGGEAFRLPAISTGVLWRAMAAPAALAMLQRMLIPPAQAFVGLRAELAERAVLRCCTALAPQVRGLALEFPDSDGLAWQLQRRFGIPVLAGGGDLTLRFSGPPGGIDLGGDIPRPNGLSLDCPGLDYLADCPRDALLAYLTEQGMIHFPDLTVLTDCTEKSSISCVSAENIV